MASIAPKVYFDTTASKTRPVATATDAATRLAPKPSPKKTEPMHAANTALVSRSATTGAMGAIDMATRATLTLGGN